MRANTMPALATLLMGTLSIGAIAPGTAWGATNCPTPQRPLQGAVIAPIAVELATVANPLGTPGSVLAQAYDESQSLDQVLLRIRIEACRDVAIVTPAPSALDPNDPAAYKPRTEFDNTPWRFNMSQNGKNMTADEFSAWMKSRGVRVARGAAPAVVPAAAPGVAPGVAPGAGDVAVPPVAPPASPELATPGTELQAD